MSAVDDYRNGMDPFATNEKEKKNMDVITENDTFIKFDIDDMNGESKYSPAALQVMKFTNNLSALFGTLVGFAAKILITVVGLCLMAVRSAILVFLPSPKKVTVKTTNGKSGAAVNGATAKVEKVVSKRRWSVGFDPITVPPKGKVTLESRPQCTFKGSKLIVTTEDHFNVYLSSIRIGNKEQINSKLGASAFAPLVNDNEIDFVTCEQADAITIEVVNESDSPKPFSCMLVGHTIL